MRTCNVVVSLLIAAGCAAPALAQDSVAIPAGLPGDAVGAYDPAAQRLNYVIDMSDLFGSWNTKFGIAPLIKTSKSSTGFFNSLPSAAGISSTARRGAAPSAAFYSEWFAPGQGVNPNPAKNSPGAPIPAPAVYTRLGAVVAEFGTDDAVFNYNGIIGSIFGYEATFPSRLYVTRYMVAQNQPAYGSPDTAQFGVGAVDSSGNVAFRADNFNIADTVNGIGGTANYFRVRMLARNPAAINQIFAGGGSDAAATDWIDLVAPLDAVRTSPTQHNTPNILPLELSSGGFAHVLGSNFATNYAWESPMNAGFNNTALHRPGTGDHRGGIHVYSIPLMGGATDVATGAMLTQSNAGGGTTDSISIWGIRADGSVGPATTVTRPAAIPDPCYGFVFAPAGPTAFEHYRSQTAARGGNGQVALGRTVNGNRLAAAMIASTASATNAFNSIAVFEDDGAAPYAVGVWKLAAWVDTPGLSGKPIHGDFGNDGFPFTGDAGEFDGNVDLNPVSPTFDAPIGRLASLFEVTGGTPVGPSLSAPMIDSAGNIWFTGAVALNKTDPFGTPFTDFDSAIIRAIFDPNADCWRLELIAELGDVFTGNNSATKYQIQFMGIADSNSVASETTWSNMIVANGWNDQPTCPTRDTRSPLNLGGLVFNAEIVYDADNDGDFEDPTASGGNPASGDQSYQTLMFIGNTRCPADFDGSGFVDTDDYDAFVQAFELGGPDADFDCSGFTDTDDFDAFVQAFERGC